MAQDTSAGQAHPTGADIRTFLFADMRGYTRFTHEHGDEAASTLAGRFADLVREAVPEFEGELLELRGDEALCVFRSARQALRASVELQRRLRTATEDAPAFPLGVGMGLDAGEAIPTEGGYRGAALNLAARLCATAKPGEVLATESAAHLARLVDGLRLVARRPVRLKGMAQPVRLVEVLPNVALPPVPDPTRRPDSARRRMGRRFIAAVVAALVVIGVLAGSFLLGAGTSGGTHARLPLAPVDALVMVNATSGTVLRSVPAGHDPIALLAVGGDVWEADGTQRALIRIDPTTGAHKTVPLGVTPTALAPGPLGSIWVAAGLAHELLQIDGHTDRVYQHVDIRGCCRGPDALRAANGGLWLADPGGTRRIDTSSGKAGAPVKTLGSSGIITDPSGTVWISDGWDMLRSVDPANGHVGAPLVVNGTGGGPAGPGAMVSTGGSLWVAATYAHSVAEINPNLAQVTQLVPLPGIPTALASTPNSVWVASNPGGVLSRIDAATGLVTKRIRLGRRIGALAVSGGTLIAATEPSQASQRATGEIAYDANWRIVVVHVDGSARHVLTHGSALSAYPTWSPDGRRMAFLQSATNIGEAPTHVYEMRANGTHLRQLTHGPVDDIDPAWSPDGRWIAFVRLSYLGATTGQIWLVKPDGSGLHRLTDHLQAYTPSWSQDGRSIIFGIGRGGGQSLGMIRSDGSHLRLLSSATAFLGAPAYSPDGVHIAYGSQGGIAITARDGQSPVQLVTSASLLAPTWSPVGTQLAMAGVLGDSSRLFIVNADGTGLGPIPGRFGAAASTSTTANGADVAWRPHT